MLPGSWTRTQGQAGDPITDSRRGLCGRLETKDRVLAGSGGQERPEDSEEGNPGFKGGVFHIKRT